MPIRIGSISLYFPDCLFGEDKRQLQSGVRLILMWMLKISLWTSTVLHGDGGGYCTCHSLLLGIMHWVDNFMSIQSFNHQHVYHKCKYITSCKVFLDNHKQLQACCAISCTVAYSTAELKYVNWSLLHQRNCSPHLIFFFFFFFFLS